MAKTQPATAVSVLIALIALFMIIYTLLLPPAERAELLNLSVEDEAADGKDVSDIAGKDKGTGIILSEKPGEVSLDLKDENTHDLNPVSLFVKSQAENIGLVNTLSISKSAFSDKFQEVAFDLDDLDDIEELNLIFFVERARGKLFIDLNGNNVFNIELDEGKLRSVNLPVRFLNRNNVVEFSIDKGDYTLEQLEFITKLKGGALLTYSFFLEDEEFDDIWDGRREAELELIFGSAGEKSARFEINGESIRMKTSDNDFSRDVSGLVKEGNNIIKIIPDDEFVIDLMEITIK